MFKIPSCCICDSYSYILSSTSTHLRRFLFGFVLVWFGSVTFFFFHFYFRIFGSVSFRTHILSKHGVTMFVSCLRNDSSCDQAGACVCIYKRTQWMIVMVDYIWLRDAWNITHENIHKIYCIYTTIRNTTGKTTKQQCLYEINGRLQG